MSAPDLKVEFEKRFPSFATANIVGVSNVTTRPQYNICDHFRETQPTLFFDNGLSLSLPPYEPVHDPHRKIANPYDDILAQIPQDWLEIANYTHNVCRQGDSHRLNPSTVAFIKTAQDRAGAPIVQIFHEGGAVQDIVPTTQPQENCAAALAQQIWESISCERDDLFDLSNDKERLYIAGTYIIQNSEHIDEDNTAAKIFYCRAGGIKNGNYLMVQTLDFESLSLLQNFRAELADFMAEKVKPQMPYHPFFPGN